MKILVAHSRYQSGSMSGENRVVEDEVTLLREAGHDVHTWTPGVEEQGRLGLVRTGAAAIWSTAAANEIATRIRRERPDVVHFHNLFPALSPAVLRATGDVPTVVTLHNYRFMCLPGTFLRDGEVCESCAGRVPWRGIVHGCYRDSVPASGAIASAITLHRAARTFARPSAYLAVSDFVREKHVAAGFPARRITVKPNFTWPTTRRVGPGGYFLFLGRLSAEKGVPTLMQAFERLDGVPLVVVGDGPEAERLKASAPRGVEFRGAVDPAELPAIFMKARALVFPSTCFEGAPRAVIEAYAAGVPVIASDIGGIPELIEDEGSGILAPPGQPDAWAKAIERLLDDDVSLQMGERAWHLWDQNFGPARALQLLEQAYRDVISGSAIEGTGQAEMEG